MYQIKNFVDLSKEEAWLSDQSAKGFFLVKKGAFGGYTFTEAEPARLTYRIDYRTFKSQLDYQDYVTLFEDTGWVHAAGSRWSGLQYFVQREGAEGEDIFSDNASKAARYRRFARNWVSIFSVYLAFFVILLINGSVELTAFLDPKELYYTPGLWEKEGFEFVRAFLFETPFALGRGFSWLLIPVFLVICLVYILKARNLGKKQAQVNTDR